MTNGENFLTFVEKQFQTYKALAEKAFSQLPDEKLFVTPSEDSNSIAMIVQHMVGNMLSRWTDFLTTDGEKEWRQRDEEFEPVLYTRQQMYFEWEKGWQALFDALGGLDESMLQQVVYVRQEGQTVLEAVNRQVAHYCYHVGQIIFLAKLLKGGGWESLSIPKKIGN